ncbi:MAG: hypothetical protein RL701_3417 [Pseudomonadota bacterium]|jgi:hypothetical protein
MLFKVSPMALLVAMTALHFSCSDDPDGKAAANTAAGVSGERPDAAAPVASAPIIEE